MKLTQIMIWTMLVMFLYGCRKDNGDVVIKLGHGLDIDHPVHKAMVFMGEKLKENSGGKIKLEIFPNEQLGSEREMIELVQLGSIAMAKTSAAPLESFIPIMGIFSVPYVFRDSEHYWKTLEGPIGKEILLSGSGVGLRGLCYYDAGSRSFYTKKKLINSPEELSSMKIRVMQSRTAMDMVKAMGANPTPIAWGELYTALQQGVVDGAENNPPCFLTSRHYEVCKYFSLNEHSMVPDLLVISRRLWESYSPEVRRKIQEAADASSLYERELWKKMTEESLEKVKAAGVEIIRPDKTPFMELVKPMHESYKGTIIGEKIRQIQGVDENI